MSPTISLPLAAIAFVSTLGERTYVFHHENVLGTSLQLRVAAGTSAAATRAEARALSEIDRQAKILSGYDRESEFSRWMKTRDVAVPVSSDLFEVLSRFDRYRAVTGGALDAAAEAVTQAWKSAAEAQRVPSPLEIEAAVAAVRNRHWALDPVRHTATHTSDTALILNSFTK